MNKFEKLEHKSLVEEIQFYKALLTRIHGQALHHPKEDQSLLMQRLHDISSWIEDIDWLTTTESVWSKR